MSLKQLSTGAIVAIAITGLFLTVLTTGLVTTSQTVPTSGTVSSVNVGVYTDPGCTQNCTSVSWGNIAPGSAITRTIYVKNTGNLPVTLSMATTNWAPTNANMYILLGWNQANTVLAAGASTSATLTLSASSNAGGVSNFSFNIVITGTN